MALLLALALAVAAAGCMRDPLDPGGKLARRAVQALEQAERHAQGREAYERARERASGLHRGMAPAVVEEVMEAFVAVETGVDESDERALPRRKVIEGFLCRVDPSPVRRRWIFGYDEGGVEMIGFALEFGRSNPDKEKWRLDGIDAGPEEGCELGGVPNP